MRRRPTTVCPTCGASTPSAGPCCHRCGADLAAPDTWRDQTGDTLPPFAAPPPPVRDRRRRRGIALISVGVVLIGAGIAAGFRAGVTAADRRAAATPTLAPTTTPPSSAAAPTGPVRSGIVEIAPALAPRPETAAVVGVLGTYFAAINRRDYRSYRTTLVDRPGRAHSEAEFRRRYRSTTDSGVRLLGLRAGDGGSWVASVGFTSRQAAVDSPDGTSTCLRWSVAFPLVPTADGFLIDTAGLATTVRRPC